MNEVVAHLATRAARRRPDGPPQRRRQPLPVLERRHPDGAPARRRRWRSRRSCCRRSSASTPRSTRRREEFWPIVKTGRTHLQDATPIRLGQEFRGYAGQVEESIRRARAAQAELLDGAARRDGGRDRHQRPSRVRLPAPCARLVGADRPRRSARRPTTSMPRRRSTPRSLPTERSGRSR